MKGLLRQHSEKGKVLYIGKQSHSSQSIEKIMLKLTCSFLKQLRCSFPLATAWLCRAPENVGRVAAAAADDDDDDDDDDWMCRAPENVGSAAAAADDDHDKIYAAFFPRRRSPTTLF